MFNQERFELYFRNKRINGCIAEKVAKKMYYHQLKNPSCKLYNETFKVNRKVQ